MAAGPEITSAAGLRRIQIFVLNTSGYPDGDQSGANGYDGVNLEGARSLSLTIPAVQRIAHVGNDRLLAQDFLPPTEGASGEIRTAKQNLTVDALLTGTLVAAVGETKVGGMLTDRQGAEVDVCVIVYRQALDTTAGAQALRRWQAHMFPVARIVPRAGTFEQGGADENVYDIIPSVATKFPWGVAFTDADNGFTEAQYLRFTAENPPVMERWTGNGTLTTFNTTWTPISTAKTKVFVNGSLVAVSSVSPSGKTITLGSAPSSGAVVVAWYETSDNV
jgi:hypothetical protein